MHLQEAEITTCAGWWLLLAGEGANKGRILEQVLVFSAKTRVVQDFIGFERFKVHSELHRITGSQSGLGWEGP